MPIYRFLIAKNIYTLDFLMHSCRSDKYKPVFGNITKCSMQNFNVIKIIYTFDSRRNFYFITRNCKTFSKQDLGGQLKEIVFSILVFIGVRCIIRCFEGQKIRKT